MIKAEMKSYGLSDTLRARQWIQERRTSARMVAAVGALGRYL